MIGISQRKLFGRGSRGRSRSSDAKRHAKYRPAKRFHKGLGGQGDWARKRYRK